MSEQRTIDKTTSIDAVVAELRDGMTIGIGGWGSRRKPMALVRAIARSGLQDLTVVSYGGPDVGLLCAVGAVRKVVYAFCSLDSIPLEPWFRVTRQTGGVEAVEMDEGMFYAGLTAAAQRLPFVPLRAGLGSDVFRTFPDLRTVTSPYDDGEELVAMPPLQLDAAFVHMNRGDAGGNAQFLGPDPYFDDLFCLAADRRYLSVEKLVATEHLLDEGPLATLKLNRLHVDAVVETPNGAHFTECPPDYGRDEAFQKLYAATASDADAWKAFRADWVDVDEDTYQANLERHRAEQAGGDA